MRRGFRPQYFFGVGIERDHDGRSAGRLSVFGGGRDDCLVTEMDAVEYSNREEYWATQIRESGNGSKNFHQMKSEIRIPKFETIRKFKIRMFETASFAFFSIFRASVIRLCFGFRYSDFGFLLTLR